MHFKAEELSGRFREDRRALPAIAISGPRPTLRVWQFGYDEVFARHVSAIGRSGMCCWPSARVATLPMF